MNDDYGYNGNNRNDKGPGKVTMFFIKYNKLIWLLLIAVAFYSGRGNFTKFINTFRYWDEIQAAKGDVLLVQHLFVYDRLYITDPENYSEIVLTDEGTYRHNVRVGSDLTLEQEKFEFNNGDTYRHVTIPYVDTVNIMDIDTLKMISRYYTRNGSAYYYDFGKEEWVKIKTLRGGTALPKNTLMYLTFNDERFVLMDQLYAYHDEDEGVYAADSELTHLAHSNIRGSGLEVLQPFSMREGMSYQSWTLESNEPLIDLESGEVLPGTDVTEKELILKELGLGANDRWLSDGIYSAVEEGYTPYGETNYYRNDNARQLDLLLAAKDSETAQQLAMICAFKLAQNINEYGYFETPVQNTKLYTDYGIRYGYADMKANAQIGQKLVTAGTRFGEGPFEDAIRALADFFAERMAEGALPEYWHYKGEIKAVSASSETRKEAAAFLKAAGELLGEPEYISLADSLK